MPPACSVAPRCPRVQSEPLHARVWEWHAGPLRRVCDLPTLARGGRKQLRDRSEQSLMPIGHDEVDVGGASLAQVLQETRPAIFVHIARKLVG
jgi:hypothetical protein